jgi:HAD superfamily hydrolase (TIGR01459 family)
MPPVFLSGLQEIADGFDAMLCDAWGVIHNGVAPLGGAPDAMAQFRAAGKPIIIITNAPRPSEIIPPQLARIGVRPDAWDAIVTSGDATRSLIRAQAEGPVFRLGPDKDDAMYEGIGARFAPIEAARFIVCTGLFDEMREEPEDYVSMLAPAAERGVVMVCANPDIVVRLGGRLIWCAGALAELYERLGGAVVYGGKPHAPIYDLAIAAAERAAGRKLDKSRILAVGDGVKTDMLGALRSGIPSLYIAGSDGVHAGAADEAAVVAALASEGADAAYWSTGLVW